NCSAGDVESAFGVGRHDDSSHRHDPNVCDSRLTLILVAIGVAIVEDLADELGAIKDRIRHDPYGGGSDVRDRHVDEVVDRPSLVDVLALTYASAHDEHESEGLALVRREALVEPRQLAAEPLGLYS